MYITFRGKLKIKIVVGIKSQNSLFHQKVGIVFDENNDMTLHTVGTAVVYDKIRSYFKTELLTKEDAVKFYTLVKALLIHLHLKIDNGPFSINLSINTLLVTGAVNTRTAGF